MGEKRVLVLGAGMVAGPLIEYLLHKRVKITVACDNVERANKLVANNQLGRVEFWEANDTNRLNELIKQHEVVVSLLPYNFHVKVAEICVANKKHLVTTSYVSNEMKLLNDKAIEADILLLNECGLDPGIDHMSAKRVIDTVHGLGGKIIKFYSITGALPAPEFSNDNPFRYKFSWSPKGVLLAGNNSAEYKANGKKVVVEGKDLFKKKFNIDHPKIGLLEAYPNRNSLPYIDLYGIPEVETMYRGTFRYKGWCEIMQAIKTLGLTSEDKLASHKLTYAKLMDELINANNDDDIKKKIAKFLKVAVESQPMQALEYLGLFSNDPMPTGGKLVIDILTELMIEKMMLGSGEKDMSVMHHLFLARYADGKQEMIRAGLLEFGVENGDTSIARTVGLPAACAVGLILDGEILVRGVQVPILPEIYNPIMIELESLGIEFIEEYGLPISLNSIVL